MAYFRLAARTFPEYVERHCGCGKDSDTAAGWYRFVHSSPIGRKQVVRGVVVDGRIVAGYMYGERPLVIGGMGLSSGYVGGVVTSPEYRGRGMGTALMRDAKSYAVERGHGLIVLRGIGGYYSRFGFTDVMETVVHRVRVAELPRAGPTNVSTDVARMRDAKVLLDLYQRHYGRYNGSYVRDVAYQEYLMRHRCGGIYVAHDSGGACGYILLPCGGDRSAAVEVAADNWLAAAALLRRQASECAGADVLTWPAPLDSCTYMSIADHLGVETELLSCPDEGFLACLGHLGRLLDEMVPVWRERWLAARVQWSGVVRLVVGREEGVAEGHGGRSCVLQYRKGELVRDDELAADRTVRIGAGRFVQLVFGFRPVWWAGVPADLVGPLGVLFPAEGGWYPASNRC